MRSRCESTNQPINELTNQRPRGFSLFELLLVLAILALAAMVVWPSLDAMYGDAQLRHGAEVVRARLLDARARAIDEGCVVQFRYEAGGRAFQLHADAAQQDARRDDPDPALPAGVRFFETAEDVTGTGERVLAVAAEEGLGVQAARAVVADSAGIAWSRPIVFRPDGTTDGGRFWIADSAGASMELRVRPMTGVVEMWEPNEGL